jgi:outer membrane protein insertion porin family
MTIYTGDVFIEGELPKQAALVAEVFQRQGFIAPKVEVTAREDPEDGQFMIRVDIEKGAYYKLKRLEISGDRAFSDTRLKLKMITWRVSLLTGSFFGWKPQERHHPPDRILLGKRLPGGCGRRQG